MYDVAIIGAGLSGMTAAALLQRRGCRTVVLEAHAAPGGCAGFYRRRGFSFDVGATTLVDFGPEGVGGQLLREIDVAPPIELQPLPGYVAWLPDRTVEIDRDPGRWEAERGKLGDDPRHREFWRRLDRIAQTFWNVARRGGRLPIQSRADLLRAWGSVKWSELPRLRYLNWTMLDLMKRCGVEESRALRGLLAMMVEDTVHAPLERAPLVHAALGITMRGAGLYRARGGMRGFWTRFTDRYEALGGELRRAHRALSIRGRSGAYRVRVRRHTSRGGVDSVVAARQVISTLPIEQTGAIGPEPVRRALQPYIQRDDQARGGAIVAFLGVPEEEVADQAWTHHQLLQSYDTPLGEGNNMFLSVSSPDDAASAPPGWRSVMISTHCELKDWWTREAGEYARRKQRIGEQLVAFARRVYPRLGAAARVFEVGTPKSYERFTSRALGGVGGVRLDLRRAGQRAVPQEIGVPGFFVAGDTTWPGVGTVACVINGRVAAEHAMNRMPVRMRPRAAGCSGKSLQSVQRAESPLPADSSAGSHQPKVLRSRLTSEASAGDRRIRTEN